MCFWVGWGVTSRKVSQQRQCLYNYINWMSIELESEDWKAKIQQNNVFIQCQLLHVTGNLKMWTKNSSFVADDASWIGWFI